jgi:hypothetical protein
MTNNLMERSAFLFSFNDKRENKDTGEIIEDDPDYSKIEVVEQSSLSGIS